MSAPNTEVSSLEFSRANGPEMALTDAGGVVTASPSKTPQLCHHTDGL